MYEKAKATWRFTRKIFTEFFDDHPLDHAAIIAFYTIFSLPAVLTITVHMAGLVFGQEQVKTEIQSRFSSIIGQDSALQIQRILEQAGQTGDSTVGTIMGIGLMVFSATTVFVALQDALNAMWEVEARPEKGWLKVIINRVLSLAMVVSMGFLLLVSLTADLFVNLFNDYLKENFAGISAQLISSGEFMVTTLLSTLIFGLIFKVLPDARIRWKNIWIGAAVTALLFNLGKFLISLILENNPLSETYGTAGALVMILIWVFYSSIIFLFGAEFTQVYSRHYDQGIRPSEHAVKVETKKVQMDHDGTTKEVKGKKAKKF
ncbi:YihY/virulence factor BrkB family protein [Roseivirga sp. BDSF3-8]|uniref:YihY/virulence factor BrkB family protein n=1 Tax=Roseivirga sp. BDSF3-8 TaxID=3241598 RepID=UPI00353221C1